MNYNYSMYKGYCCLFYILFFFFSLKADEVFIIAETRGSITTIIAAKVIERAYTDAGIKHRFQYMSLEKSLLLAKAGKSDAELVRSSKLSDQFPDMIMIEEPLLNIEFQGYYLNRDIVIENLEDLKPYKICYMRGVKFFDTVFKDYNVILCDNVTKGLELLQARRIDVLVAGKYSGVYSAKQMGITNLIFTPKLIEFYGYHFIHKRFSEYVPLLNFQLKKLDPELFFKEFLMEGSL